MINVSIIKEEDFPLTEQEIKDYIKICDEELPLLKQLKLFALSNFQKETGISPTIKIIDLEQGNTNRLLLPILPFLELLTLNKERYTGEYRIVGNFLVFPAQADGNIKVRYSAGIGEDNLNFPSIKSIILEYMAFLYENRGGVKLFPIERLRRFRSIVI